MEEKKTKICACCGAMLGETDKFCRKCGAPVPKGDLIDHAEVPPEPQKCKVCGAALEAGAAFCAECGAKAGETAPAGAATVPAADGAVGEAVSGAAAKKRKIASLVYLIAGGVMALGFIFLCTPFIWGEITFAGLSAQMIASIMGEDVSASRYQIGLSLIGTMFGGGSDLTDLGVNVTLLRWAGWLVFAYLLSMIYYAIMLVINKKKKKPDERPYGLIQSASALFVAGLGLLIMGCVAIKQMNDNLGMAKLLLQNNSSTAALAKLIDYSVYLGFVAVFVMSLVAFGGVVFAQVYASGTYPPRVKVKGFKNRMTGVRKLGTIVDLIVTVVLLVCMIFPAFGPFGYNSDKEIIVKDGDSGRAQIVANESYNSMKVGTQIFKMDGLQNGTTYTFRIEADMSATQLTGSVMLFRYSDVKDKSSKEIMTGGKYIDFNKEAQDGYATITFKYSTLEPQAVVIGFLGTGEITVKYKYSLTKNVTV